MSSRPMPRMVYPLLRYIFISRSLHVCTAWRVHQGADHRQLFRSMECIVLPFVHVSRNMPEF